MSGLNMDCSALILLLFIRNIKISRLLEMCLNSIMNTLTFPFFLKEILEKVRSTKQRQVLLKSWPGVVYFTTWQDL